MFRCRCADFRLTDRLSLRCPLVLMAYVVEVFASSSVLVGARDLWGRCLLSALAAVVAHRDMRAQVQHLVRLVFVRTKLALSLKIG